MSERWRNQCMAGTLATLYF